MRLSVLSAMLAATISLLDAKPVKAYDMDCAIMLCMAGGFPPSAVCIAAYAEMIRRITPRPSRPPFGICSFASVPVDLGGPGGEEELDISIPEYAWLRRTRVLWFHGRSYEPRDEPRQWDWHIRSCDHENANCRTLVRVHASDDPWPARFNSENDQSVPYPEKGSLTHYNLRSVMVEYGDYNGNMGRSEWFSY